MRRASLALLLLLFGCIGGEPESILEAGARFPTEEGVVSSISFERVELDGNRAFRIAQDVESFSSAGHKVTPLLHWKDRYVHVGLRDDEDEGTVVDWIAGIGIVAKTDDPFVLYAGVFEKVVRGRAVFEDGTTLAMAPGLEAPRKGAKVVVTLDASDKRIKEIRGS